MIDLEALSEAASCLEPLPTSVIRLASLLGSAEVELSEVAEIVRYDPALTASLLRAANSSWSGSRTRITTVTDAIVRLGIGQVLATALGVNVRRRLDTAVPEYGLDEGELWAHSVAASIAADCLAPLAGVRLPVETSTAALLHDIGKLVMSRFLDPGDLHAVHAAHEVGVSRAEAEIEVLGVDHAELGGLIAQSWGLPDQLIVGITNHHAPERVDDVIACGVHVADAIAKRVRDAEDDNADLESLLYAVGELEMTANKIDQVCTVVAERFDEVAGRFGH
ncbi:MAG: HDOD domain-containing protein [Actinomycetota bacterium]|nr:HDOD domain-containing protein [Actinomycetota bacterium]